MAGVEGVVMGAGEEVSMSCEAGVVGWVVFILMLVDCWVLEEWKVLVKWAVVSRDADGW